MLLTIANSSHRGLAMVVEAAKGVLVKGAPITTLPPAIPFFNARSLRSCRATLPIQAL
jgi:hypothetical protein